METNEQIQTNQSESKGEKRKARKAPMERPVRCGKTLGANWKQDELSSQVSRGDLLSYMGTLQ